MLLFCGGGLRFVLGHDGGWVCWGGRGDKCQGEGGFCFQGVGFLSGKEKRARLPPYNEERELKQGQG